MSADFEVSFNVAPMLGLLDLAACRILDLYSGPETHWFFNFRRGVDGLASRLRGVESHYGLIHAWYPA